MKQIVLVRHATAVGQGPDVDDFSRTLNKKGRREARSMVKWYRQGAGQVDLLLSSPADRAIETARIFAKGLGYPVKKIVKKKKLYSSLAASDFLKLVQGLDEKYDGVMIFGHDPSFSEFARFLVKSFREDLPKCAVFAVGTRRQSWHRLSSGDGQIELFQHPRGLENLANRAREMQAELSSGIEEGVLKAVTAVGLDCAAGDLERIRRAASKLARRLTRSQVGQG